MPRKKYRGIWPIDLPKIKQHVLTGMYDGIRTEHYPFYKEKLKTHTRQVEEAELWWVAKPMAILASHAKEDLPAGQTLPDTGPFISCSISQLYKLLEKVGEDAGLDHKLRLHSLRSTFITQALDAGVSERDVMLAAGHMRLTTTAYYDQGYKTARVGVSDAVVSRLQA